MRFLLGILVVCLCLPVMAKDYTQYLPSDTLLVYSLQNVTDLKNTLQKHPVGQFLQDEATQKFLQKPIQKLQTMLSSVTEENWEQYACIIQGQVLLAVTEVDIMKQSAGALLLIETGSETAKASELMNKLSALAEKQGGQRVTKEFMGENVFYLLPPSEEGENQQPPVYPCYAVVGDALMVGINDSVIKQMISNIKGSSGGLLQNETYKATMEKAMVVGYKGVLYLNIGQLWQILQQVAEQDPSVGMVITVLDKLGLTSVRGIAATGSLNEDGSSRNKVFVYVQGEEAGLRKMFQAREENALLPNGVSEDVASYVGINLNLIAIWEKTMEIVAMFEEKMGPDGGQFSAGIQQLEQQLGFSISNDFLPTLGREFSTWKEYQLPFSQTSEVTTISLSLKNAENFKNYLNSLLMMNGMEFVTKEYMDTTIHSIPVPEGYDMEFGSFAVTNTHFIFSNRLASLEKAIRLLGKQEGNLSASASFQNGISKLSGSKDMVYYANIFKEIEFVSGMLPNILGMMMNEEMAEWIDMGAFPSAEVWQKYFNCYQVSRMTVVSDGLTIEDHTEFVGKK